MKKFVKVILFGLALVFLMGFGQGKVFASDGINISVLGKEIESDVEPFYLEGRTMVPIRFVSEALGAKVDWNEEYQSITIEKPYTKQLNISLKSSMPNTMIGYNYVQDGYYGAHRFSVYLDVAPVLRDGRAFLPARIIAEELGYYVSWDEKTNSVNITKEYVSGQTYKEYLQTQNKDPYGWSPYIKDQFEATMVERGYFDSKKDIIYKKSSVVDGEGYYTVYVKFNGDLAEVVSVNVKTGWFRR